MPKGEVRKLVIPGVKIPSWNTLYAAGHWSTRSELAKEFHSQVRYALDPELEPFDGVVDIEVVGYFENKPLDPDNLPAKVFIDGLKGWYLLDDTMDYIRNVTTRSELDPSMPRLEITITQVGDKFPYVCSCCEHRWPTRKIKNAHEKSLGAFPTV